MKKLYKHQGVYYVILKEVSQHMFNELNQVKEYRDLIGSNHVLKDRNKYLFCEIIEDAEVLEYVSEDNHDEEE